MPFRSLLAGTAAAAILLPVTGWAGDPFRISVESQLVLLPVTVTDRNGKTLAGLAPARFQVFEDSRLCPIVSVVREEAPVSFGIVLDLSGSMRAKRADAIAAVRAIVEAAEPEDNAFLVTFSDQPEIRSGFTSNLDSLPERVLLTPAAGGTALVDAIYMGLQQLKAAPNPRKALIVITDGGDNQSRYSPSELSTLAVESDAQIYTMAIFEDVRSASARSGLSLLESLAASTGGLHFTVRDRSALPGQAARLATAMKNLYVISYRPPEGEPGKWRKVRVTVNGDSGKELRIASRAGYYPPL